MEATKVSDHLVRNYENYYEEGDSEWRWLGAQKKTSNIISLCKNMSIRSVIEIGAGEGSILERLSELNFGEELYALEISSTGVETIKKRGIPRLIECKSFNGYDILYDDNRFDLAVLSHVIEHVEYPRKLIYEASRVAKYVFIEVPLEDTIRLPQDFVFDKVGHINFYTAKSIRRLIQSCNLEVIKQELTNSPKDIFIYQKGMKGLINYYIKECFLKVLPNLACKIFTYNSAMICQ